eukprot:m51a1_g9652 putative S-adenosyl-methionine-sterol-C-methyltransferase (361) ;mRNA; r:1187519-1189143
MRSVYVAGAVGIAATIGVAWTYRGTLARAAYRVRTFVRASATLLSVPRESIDRFWSSYEVFDTEALTSQTTHHVVDWYAMLNHLCSLGDVERMYLPPVIDEAGGISRNQDLFEEKMCKDMAVGPLSKVLEIGCGRGRIAAHVHEVSGATVYGMNIEPSQIVNAREHAKELGKTDKLQFLVGDYNDGLPFPDNSLDAAYNIGAITYVRGGDFLPLFRELYRVLRPGGRFSTLDWCKLPALDLSDPRHVEMLRQTKPLIGAVYTPSAEDYVAAFKKAGFEIFWDGIPSKDGHQYQIVDRAHTYFTMVQTVVTALCRLHIVPQSVPALLDRFNRGGQALIAGDKERLWTMVYQCVAVKPSTAK